MSDSPMSDVTKSYWQVTWMQTLANDSFRGYLVFIPKVRFLRYYRLKKQLFTHLDS